MDSSIQPSSATQKVARSVDGGRTFTESAPLASVPRQYPDVGSLAVDASHGPFGGRVYATWEPGDFGAHSTLVDGKRVREESGTTRGVAVASSLDGARTWLPPIRIEVPTAGPAYMSTAAVWPRGTVGELWIQHERYETDPLCYRPYFAASTDGGASCSSAVAVADHVSCPARTRLDLSFSPTGHAEAITSGWRRARTAAFTLPGATRETECFERTPLALMY